MRCKGQKLKITYLIICFFLSSTLFFSNILNAEQLNADQLTADQLTADQVKVLYIYNFVKHIKWPNEKDKKSYKIAVYQDKVFYQKLNKALANQKVNNKPIQVSIINNIQSARAVDLVFIPEKLNQELPSLANAVRGTQTLVVTNNSANKHDVMINLFFNQDKAVISFEINKSNIIFEQLNLSPELLLLGGTELDVATLYRQTEQAIQNIKAEQVVLNRKIIAQNNEISTSTAQLDELHKKMSQGQVELKQFKNEMIKIEQSVVEQKEQLAKKEHALTVILTELKQAKSNLTEQQQKIAVAKKSEIQRFKENSLILAQQRESIDKQKYQLSQQQSELLGSKEQIDSQQITIVIISFLILLAVFIVLVVIFLLIKNKRTNKQLTETIKRLEQTQNQLIESEKMASLGSLVAGVAHEINTPLGIAITSTSLIFERTQNIEQMLNDKTLKQKDLTKFIDVVKQSSKISNNGLDRVIILLNNFKQVAADQIVEQPREINFSAYIDEVFTTLVGEMKRKNIKHHLSGLTDILITTIPGALAQVITNLVTNSVRHGFAEKETGNIYIDIGYSEIGCIKLVYKDDGVGIKEEYINKVFDPFFTTMRNSGGTGLGLNIVYNIITQKLAGNITLKSTYGEGVVFTIEIPKEIAIDG